MAVLTALWCLNRVVQSSSCTLACCNRYRHVLLHVHGILAVSGMCYYRWSSVLLLMSPSFMSSQDMDTIQAVFKALDPGLTGKPVPERSYAEDCSFTYDSISKACDRFLIAHALGWFGKQIMLRDTWLCIWLSFVFEILEYLFTFLQPNFAECWWDHVSRRYGDDGLCHCVIVRA